MTRTVLAGATAILLTLAATATAQDPVTSVQESAGEYIVSASFEVAGSAHAAREVLTDYANIPRFMPDVQSSVVLERQAGHVRVEQQALPKFMWFSRQISLLLDVEEGADAIRFRDTCNKSFSRYEGAWTITADNAHTRLTYALVARPAFSVPSFVLRKLLKRDAVTMIGRLQAEIRARAATASPPDRTSRSDTAPGRD